MLPKRFADLTSFTRDIEVLSTVLNAGEFKFVGGEPLLPPQLLDFLRVAKEAQIADWLVLVTNGVLLHKAPDELWDLIDGMWISLYPGVKYRFDWEWIQRIADEHKIFVWRKETPEFVESSLIEEIANKEFVRMISRLSHFSARVGSGAIDSGTVGDGDGRRLAGGLCPGRRRGKHSGPRSGERRRRTRP